MSSSRAVSMAANAGHSVSVTLAQPKRDQLVTEWRARADRYDAYARSLRRHGDGRAAEDAEAAAVDYRQAADDLEIGWHR